MDGWQDEWQDGWMDGKMNDRMDGWMESRPERGLALVVLLSQLLQLRTGIRHTRNKLVYF